MRTMLGALFKNGDLETPEAIYRRWRKKIWFESSKKRSIEVEQSLLKDDGIEYGKAFMMQQ
ncbi:hypothetical protein [Dubosiella newyorkensis]|uniref:hypothetical protein n=1 Tax=Dubosiella newyorkensis TaxID=1862672 RepID=UPI003F67E9A9